MNGVTQKELSFLLLLWGLSDLRIAELREMPRCFSIKLHRETQVSDRLGMSGGGSPRHAQNPLSGERRKTLSITPPCPRTPTLTSLSVHHLISSIDYNVFIGGGGKGVTSAWSPLGNFLEGQAHPNLSSNQVLLFFDVKFFVFAFRWFFTEVVMFIFGWFSV